MKGKGSIWYVEKAGTWYGPFSQAILQNYFEAGKLDLDTRLRQSPQEEGRALSQWPELLQSLKKAPDHLAKKPNKSQPMVLVPQRKKKSPLLLLAALVAALLPLGLLLLPHNHPLHKWLVQNPQRKDLQSRALPAIEPMLQLAVERMLSFQRRELGSMTEEYYPLEKSEPLETWTPFYPHWHGTTWPLLQPDGLRLTLLLDEQEACFAVSFQGPGWEKIQQKSIFKADWQPPMVEQPLPLGSQWIWQPLPQVRVRLIWRAGSAGATLERILVEDASWHEAAPPAAADEQVNPNPL